MTNWNSDYVAVLPPVPGDMFVVTTIQGQRVALQPIADYDKAVAIAQAFAGRTRHPIKVLCLSPHELLAFMGVSVANFVAGMSPTVEREFRQLAIGACSTALRDCNDPSVRADAHRLLTQMEVIKER